MTAIVRDLSMFDNDLQSLRSEQTHRQTAATKWLENRKAIQYPG